MNRQKFLVAIFCMLYFWVGIMPAQATSLTEQYNNDRKKSATLNSQLADQKAKMAATTKQLLALKQSQASLQSSIKRSEAAISTQQNQLNQLTAQNQKLIKKRQDNEQKLGVFVKNDYENGYAPYLAVLLEAQNLSDLLRRAAEVHAVIKNYADIENNIESLSQNIKTKQTQIKSGMVQMQQTLAQKQQSQKSLQTTMAAQNNLLAGLTVKQKATLLASQQLQVKINSEQQLIQEQEREAALVQAGIKAGINPAAGRSHGISTPVSVGAGGGGITSYASGFLGVPYVWGGTSPSGFDCSGFVQHVYQHFGVDLNRTSEAQFGEGMSVSRDNLQPGDLVFFSTYAPGASHVGIYVGNNTMIDASSNGVSYDDLNLSYWGSRYLGARRVIQ